MTTQQGRRPIGRRFPGAGRKTFWTLAGVMALLALFALLHTWTRIAVYQRGFQLGRAQREHRALSHELESLRLEVATLESTARVEREAAERLQMQKPTPERVVQVKATQHAGRGTAGAGSVASHASKP
jgi:cell division protein FtsL